MDFVWKCEKCEKEYSSNGEGLVPPVFYSNVLSTRLHSLKCTCGGDVTLCPTKRAMDAAAAPKVGVIRQQ